MRMIATASLLLGMAGALPGCDREVVPAPAIALTPKPSSELVDELAPDPERLKELRRLCVEERDQVEEELCAASVLAAERLAAKRPDSMVLVKPDAKVVQVLLKEASR